MREWGRRVCNQLVQSSLAGGEVSGWCHGNELYQSLGSRGPGTVCLWSPSSGHLPFGRQGEVFYICNTAQGMSIKYYYLGASERS